MGSTPFAEFSHSLSCLEKIATLAIQKNFYLISFFGYADDQEYGVVFYHKQETMYETMRV